jgi:hypothetical protein
MPIAQQIDKPDYNEEFRTCDFSTILEVTDTVSAAFAVILDKTGADVSAAMLSNVTVAVGNKGVRYKLKGGTAGEKYTLSIQVETASLQKFEEPFTVCIV